ncbi:polyhydroxyalkanoate synthesis repressor PhaR [Marinivivus vitaminiproducens]|uniref:polyhydroxyalkanoate synthesis repressor PhaR n=1 Tax=Marinivivus vitaminiproducens TaxID=3035935 RepID=UPI0027A36F5B|nr:polyhydroxyalkanoate synthesis repressor PhaR [Geminicoccaceae bacterium SCSIO 64248]
MSTTTAKASEAAPEDDVAVVKKYANRRLYNTATSSYVTLDELCHLVRNGKNFLVFDAKTGEDITRSVLTQIILEEDGKGRNLLPISFLRQIIGYYDDNLRAFLPRYLELSMENFVSNQEQISKYIEGTLGRLFPLGPFEDIARQNMALFQRAATAFTPFNVAGGRAQPGADEAGETDPKAVAARIRELEAEIARLKAQAQEPATPPKT